MQIRNLSPLKDLDDAMAIDETDHTDYLSEVREAFSNCTHFLRASTCLKMDWEKSCFSIVTVETVKFKVGIFDGDHRCPLLAVPELFCVENIE